LCSGMPLSIYHGQRLQIVDQTISNAFANRVSSASCSTGQR
jgi:hypothetical protein